MAEEVEIAIVGSGFSGLAMGAQLKRAGEQDFVMLERAREVGGTWRDNTYPGCACDVPSHLYSLSFAPNAEWSSTFSPQREIGAYLRRVTDDEGLTPHLRFGHELEEARWDAARQRWSLKTAGGDIEARILISAAGPLSAPKLPEIPGLLDFGGRVFHSATWDHAHDLTGERVAVIGTGASSIQFIPEIQPEVDELYLFQRTPAWVMPRRARKLTRLERLVYRHIPGAQRVMREALYWGRELYAIPMLRVALSPVVAKAATRHLEKQVKDPVLRAKLTPAYAPGCKRILLSDDYFPALTQPNVEVLTGGAVEIRGNTIVAADGSAREVDTIICGTGFHVTDLPIAERIHGRDGRSLSEQWNGSLGALRGTAVANFPNLFLLLGPNTGLGHNSVVVMAEAQVDYVLEALEAMQRADAAVLEARPEAELAWNDQVQEQMKGTVWSEGGCESWYFDAQGRNTTLWPNFSFRYRQALARFDESEYSFEPATTPLEPVEVAA